MLNHSFRRIYNSTIHVEEEGIKGYLDWRRRKIRLDPNICIGCHGAMSSNPGGWDEGQGTMSFLEYEAPETTDVKI